MPYLRVPARRGFIAYNQASISSVEFPWGDYWVTSLGSTWRRLENQKYKPRGSKTSHRSTKEGVCELDYWTTIGLLGTTLYLEVVDIGSSDEPEHAQLYITARLGKGDLGGCEVKDPPRDRVLVRVVQDQEGTLDHLQGMGWSGHNLQVSLNTNKNIKLIVHPKLNFHCRSKAELYSRNIS